MAVDPRQVVAGFLTLSMFVMLGNMIKHDHFSSSTELDFLKKILGCYEAEVSIAIGKLPCILALAEDKLRRTVEFLKMKTMTFNYVVSLTDKTSVEKFLDHYRESAPGIADAYAAVLLLVRAKFLL
ncbi:hypothetical protein HU200_010169 [Digitaria exilis]|uniref:Uncharacterized protein n=1 Tax=Digitaria exilis TaxID=1010633 RepID=A0A835KNQ0_9POAL|nr:hypothetical protein HU200_010169 [Digitaria exilis]